MRGRSMNPPRRSLEHRHLRRSYNCPSLYIHSDMECMLTYTESQIDMKIQAIYHALRSYDILLFMTQYQPGCMHEDFIPFKDMHEPWWNVHSTHCPKEEFDCVVAIVKPWLHVHGSRRLDKLFFIFPATKNAVLQVAVFCGFKEVVQTILFKHHHFDLTNRDALASIALCGGQMDMLSFLTRVGYKPLSRHVVWWCLQFNREDAVRCAITEGVLPVAAQYADIAASFGLFDLFHWIVHRTGKFTTGAMDGAATYGHFEFVKYLHTEREEGCTTQALDGAITSGHYDVANYLLENRKEGFSKGLVDDAISCGNLDILKFLHAQRRITWSNHSYCHAPWRGHYEVVLWLHQHAESIQSTGSEICDAANSGHLEMVKYLHSFQTSEYQMHCAVCVGVTRGHFEIVKYFLENVQIQKQTIQEAILIAAAHGHFKIVEYIWDSCPVIDIHDLENMKEEDNYWGYTGARLCGYKSDVWIYLQSESSRRQQSRIHDMEMDYEKVIDVSTP